MKKLIIVLVLLLAATALFGQIKLGGAFPSAKFLDAPKGGEYDYQAVWEFSENNIRILDTSGNVQWDFAGKTIENFKAGRDEKGVVVTFTCPEAERAYTFRVISPNEIEMTITRNGPMYVVKMPRQ